jgi:hypothetical protein
VVVDDVNSEVGNLWVGGTGQPGKLMEARRRTATTTTNGDRMKMLVEDASSFFFFFL